jgi:type IV pilus assembly protein PilC
VETGEASGNLAIVLEQLANYLEQKAEFKRKIISATIYPVILFFVAVGAIFFFVMFIIPKFTDLFSGFGIQLPFLTRVMVNLSEFIRRRFLIGVIGFIGLFFILRLIIRTPQGRKRFDQLKFKLPLLGRFFKTLVTERFTSEISTLIESGVPILYALEITERSIGNKVVEEIIRDVKSNVREGRSFAKPLEESGFFPPMVVQMVSIGEEIGEVSKMLKRVSSFYAKAIETFISRMTAMFEPLMLIFMGAIIGVIVISMFLPIFQIATVGAK